ncbi:MAG: AarF/ABC1/UbiB kinase family protein, partial [Verrucomicrobiae bacterium]|nr:AarF/ABC1/UbiB kinase family protein [Verrucomicrobiae bacterium]
MKLGAGLAGSYLAHHLSRPFADGNSETDRQRSLRRRNARQVREGLQALRGPIMKLGQVASMQGHLLGPEMLEELSTLQRQAPPMHPTLMRVQFRNALGREPEEVFRSFTAEAASAASLGQVHRAVTKDGDEVAVKIQYPAIREAIESDFKLLRTALLPARATGHIEAKAIREAERGILEEADYLKESKNVAFFEKQLAPLPFVRVPRVWKEYSARQVLTMSWLDGAHLKEFLAAKPSQEMRDRIGERLMRLFFFQLFRVRALHADPHPGNYLFG